MKTKICTVCNKDKPISEFHKHFGQKSGLRPECKECSKKKSIIYIKRK